MTSTVAMWILAGCFALAAAFLALIWRRLQQPMGDNLESVVREELRIGRAEAATQARELRAEIAANQTQSVNVLVDAVGKLGADQTQLLENVRGVLDARLRDLVEDQRKHLSEVVSALRALENTHRAEQQKAREALENKFKEILKSNEEKLEQMRQTVDEKLHSTLERRLGESFKLVSDRLEAVQRGLGEMQTLANGVGDLKKVLANVKERGTWGEYQLGAILQDILTPDQYARNVKTKPNARETVEYAVKLPGREDRTEPVWLPIDSKFPKEPYERLLEASQRADAEGVERASAELRRVFKQMAADIQDKYLDPPNTTEFAILFVPTEGLYAEILRQPGLHDEMQRKHRVLLAGPTTLAAILSSLRIGFQTLAIQKRTSEVWEILRAVKTEFGKFGDVLAKVQKQISTVSETIEKTSRHAHAIERKLQTVERLPEQRAKDILQISEGNASAGDTPPSEEPLMQ
jgi:DNA recombination protein RmuC